MPYLHVVVKAQGGLGRRGAGSGLEGVIRSVGFVDNASFTAWQPCLHGTTKSKVNKTGRLNEIRQAILYVYRLTYVREGENPEGRETAESPVPVGPN